MSAPTISRFEIGEQDIQLSSAFRILEVLGMIDHRSLSFPDPRPRREDADYDRVDFYGQDGDQKVLCRVGLMALFDRFRFTGSDPMEGYLANRAEIERLMRRQYLLGQVEGDGSVWLKRREI